MSKMRPALAPNARIRKGGGNRTMKDQHNLILFDLLQAFLLSVQAFLLSRADRKDGMVMRDSTVAFKRVCR